MEGSDFLRIEGHIGKTFDMVLAEISDYRQKYNLPFQVVAVKIGEEFNEELFQFFCDEIKPPATSLKKPGRDTSSTILPRFTLEWNTGAGCR